MIDQHLPHQIHCFGFLTGESITVGVHSHRDGLLAYDLLDFQPLGH